MSALSAKWHRIVSVARSLTPETATLGDYCSEASAAERSAPVTAACCQRIEFLFDRRSTRVPQAIKSVES